MNGDTGAVVTVEGRLDPDELGVTLPHEHLFLDGASTSFELPDEPYKQRLAKRDVSLDILGYVRQNPLAVEDNRMLASKAEAIEEVAEFHQAGGDAIVDLTSKDDSDPRRVRAVSRATDVHVIHGTSYYVRKDHPDRIDRQDVSDLEAEFVADVEEGIFDTRIRAGIVGEIGLSGTIHDQEEKVLRAGARAAARTGAPLNIHPPIFGPEPVPVGANAALDVVEEEGLSLDRVVVSHLDGDHYALQDCSDHATLADRGAYVEFDLWGGWNIYLERHDHTYPSDATRVDAVLELLRQGYEDRLLLSHDVCTKMQLTKYGGFGYSHLLNNVVPWLYAKDVSWDTIDRILVDNPRRVLTFDEPG